MLDISISSKNNYSKNFKSSRGQEGIKYRITVNVEGFVGKPYSAYFGMVILNEKNKEMSRKIQWLNDFSGKKYQKSLVFSFPKDGKKMVSIIRVNSETPVKTETHLKIDGLDNEFEEVDKSFPENFLLTSDFQIPLSDELTKEQEEILEKNLVWIIGPPRSGTSWLGTKLLSYQTLSMNEPQIGLHIGMRQPHIKEKIVRNIDLFKKEPDYFFSQQYSATWKYYLRKLIINRIFSQFQNLTHKIIIKEPNGSMGMDIITQCLPLSKIIFLVRDGRDITDSRIDAFRKDSWAIKDYGFTPFKPNERLNEIRNMSKLWVKLMDILETSFDKHSEDKKILVKYENLRKDTLKELKKIYSFLEIDIPSEKLEKIVYEQSFENIPKEFKGEGKAVRAANPGKWKTSFSDEEKTIMEEIMGEKLKQLGY